MRTTYAQPERVGLHYVSVKYYMLSYVHIYKSKVCVYTPHRQVNELAILSKS